MPRIARPISGETLRVRDALAKHIESSERSTNSFARRHGLKQYALSRFLTGVTKSVTPEIRRALSYAGIDPKDGITDIGQSVDNPRLRRALEKTWDGTPQMADLLAEIIEALGPALARSTRPRQERP